MLFAVKRMWIARSGSFKGFHSVFPSPAIKIIIGNSISIGIFKGLTRRGGGPFYVLVPEFELSF